MNVRSGTHVRYDRTAILLHWAIAFLIATAFLLGLTVDDFSKTYKDMVVNAHSLLGLGVLLLTLIRIGWRLGHPPPPAPKSTSAWMERISKLTHALLYFLMLSIPLIGLPTLFYRGRGLDFGLFQLPAFLTRTPAVFRPLTELHELGAYALIALAAGHVAAALYHQWVLRDTLMARMLPGRNLEGSL
jgi:cytochrome b561